MIEVEKLTREYGALKAVDDLSFAVGKGEIVGFLGPNGAGKSTTMRILAGSLGATHGTARIGGFDVAHHPQKVQRIIGYLPESPPLYTDMTVSAYLRYCARLKRAKDPKGGAERAITRVGLGDVAHRLIGHLSKGFRQRVGVAQALVHDPEVLVLDEPSSGLDPSQRVEIRRLVQELAQGDVTVILSTHILPEVEAICDRVIILHEGRIVAQDTLASLSASSGAVRIAVTGAADELGSKLSEVAGVVEVAAIDDGVFRVQSDGDVRAQLARVAVDYGLVELTEERAGLEEVFLRVTGGST